MFQSMRQPSGNYALDGVRVIDLSQFGAGATCAQFLAWLGADVVKVEPPTGDKSRYSATDAPGVDSFEFILSNANKRSVVGDLESERGKDDLNKLIASADVVVEHLAPRVTERLGLGYENIRQINPRLIFAQIKGFPFDGPRADYLSTDMVAQAAGGPVSGTGYLGGAPLKPGLAIGDVGTALHCAMGILAALHQRGRTGRGQRVLAIMQGAMANLCRITYQVQLMHGKPPDRVGNVSRVGAAPSNIFHCRPGGPNDYVFVNISRGANAHWPRLLKAIGRDDLVDDPRFSTPQVRHEHREEAEAVIAAWCSKHTKIEAMEAIQRAGAPAGAVFDTQELSDDPHLRKRGMFATIEHPVRGAITLPGWPVKMSESSVPVRSAPLLGAHTQEVLTEWLIPRVQQPSDMRSNLAQRAAQVGVPQPALHGIRIVDLTQFEAGTSCTEALAWLGADVVKVEQPGQGDRGRIVNTDRPGVDSHFFVLLNANKRSLACDLKSERGKALLRKLIVNADVLVENMAPGVIERLGFGYDAVRELNPRIVYAQIKGFPADGTRARYLCQDMIAQAVGGSMSVTGIEGDTPLKPAPNLGDTGAGMHCATGVVAAIYQRQQTGRGQRIEVAMQEAVINFSRSAYRGGLTSGKPAPRRDLRNAPNEIYRCNGGGANDYCHVAVAQVDNEDWRKLLRAIGRGDLMDDPRFTSEEARGKHVTEIEALLAAWCRKHSKIEAMDILQRAGVVAAAVLDTNDLIQDADLRKSSLFAEMVHSVRGPVIIPAWPVKLSESEVPVRSAPLLGAHTEEVLSEWLALSRQEIEKFSQLAPAAS